LKERHTALDILKLETVNIVEDGIFNSDDLTGYFATVEDDKSIEKILIKILSEKKKYNTKTLNHML